MSEPGPREMVGDERHAVLRQHVEYAQPGSDGLLRVGIEDELDARPLDHQTMVMRDVPGKTQRLAARRNEVNRVTDGVAGRRHRLNARDHVLAWCHELD